MIGKTPPLNLVPIEQSEGLEANLLGKLEYFNHAGSIKDRIAKAMIDDAAASGKRKHPKIEARTITALLPDTGDRYLSTPLFAD